MRQADLDLIAKGLAAGQAAVQNMRIHERTAPAGDVSRMRLTAIHDALDALQRVSSAAPPAPPALELPRPAALELWRQAADQLRERLGRDPITIEIAVEFSTLLRETA